MLLSKTPVRIEIGGGATDVEPYSTDYGGYVVNVTINLFIRCFIARREDKRISITVHDEGYFNEYESTEEIENDTAKNDIILAILKYLKPSFGMDLYIHSQPPKKAGLGASASLCTAIISNIQQLTNGQIDKSDIAEKAYTIEQYFLKNEGGRQDQYAAVYGGFNSIEFLGGSKVIIRPINLVESFKKLIEDNLILFYTGTPHVSGNLVKDQVELYRKDKETAKASLDKLKEIAYEMTDSLIEENFEQFGKLLTDDWKIKSDFNPSLTTEYMKVLNDKIINNGGIGGRVCGAGGGGCMLWLVSPEKKQKIIQILKNQHGKLIEYQFVNEGLKIMKV